jgi:hypothetical protein
MYPVLMEVGLGLVVVWMAGLTFVVWKNLKLLKVLVPTDGKGEGLDRKIVEIVNRLDTLSARERVVLKALKDLADDQQRSVSKTAMSRYNPYKDVGGDQSFSIILLNGMDTGLVVTSLHTRSGTRIYSKQITNGKTEVELSSEERNLLKEVLG